MYPHYHTIWAVNGKDEFDAVLETLRRHSILAVDTETEGLDPLAHKLVSVQIATPECGYVFYAARHDLEGLKDLLEDPARTLLLQYAPFDYGFLLRHLSIDISKARIYDTRAAEIAIGAEGGHSLKALHKKYVGTELDKGPQTTFKYGDALSLGQCRYAAIDVLCLFPITLGQGIEALTTHIDDKWLDAGDDPFVPMRSYLDGSGPFPARA